MPDQRCTGHAVILWDSIGLPGSDDPHIGEKSRFSNFPKWSFDQNEDGFRLINTLGRIF